ncbi:MAG: RHS repeat-associated core domain-containing protein, partial [Solirubrobacteraceae bacterium]
MTMQRSLSPAAGSAWLTLASALAACAPSATSTRSQQATRTTDRITYYHQALAAGPSILTRADGSVLDERRDEPFGASIDGQLALDPHNALNKETDAATGWSDHGARWMAPETGRWLTPDPPVMAPDPGFMTAPWALHPYQYVGQNPVAFWDPDGRDKRSSGSLDSMRSGATYTITVRRFAEPAEFA